MPIYEYECKACGHRLEAIQKISDDVLTQCPECDKPELKKLISAAGFRLKGGGWYETDFKSGNKKNLAQAEASKDTSKQDSKTNKKENKTDGTKKAKPGGTPSSGAASN